MSDDDKPKDDGNEERVSRKRQGSQAIEIPGTGSEEGTSNAAGPSLPPWVAGGSPAKFLTHEEIIKMSTEMENLELVHEIAIDPNYKIPDKPVNPIEMCVKENMHKVYFNMLRKDLAKDPPEYEFCIGFLMELKSMLLDDILTTQHVRLRAEVNSILDEASLKNKLDQNALDIVKVMKSVIDMCSRLCAPERDSRVAELRTKTDVIDLFQGTMELLELMKNDLTNYQISKNRVAIEEYSAKHEYDEFQKYLADHPYGCDLTKQWLSIAYDELFGKEKKEKEESNAKREKKNDIEESDGILVDTTSKAYVKLVQSENPDPYPETMKIDKVRVQALAEKFSQIVLCASAVFVTCNVAGKQISESDGFKRTLKDHLVSITNNIDEETIKADLEKIGEQCIKESKESAEKLNLEWDEQKSTSIRNQINALFNLENPIRALVVSRVSTFVEEMLRSPTTVPHRLLPGLSVIQSELCAFTARFLRLCVHNRKTFYELYQSVILEFQVDKGGVVLDRSFCREASPSQPGPSTSK